MTYTIIGTGNMAWFLGSRLNGAGFECKAVYGRNEREAKKLSESMNAYAVTDLSALPETDCCIVTVSDSVIAEITEHLGLKKTVVIHTAGSVSIDVIGQGGPMVHLLHKQKESPLSYRYPCCLRSIYRQGTESSTRNSKCDFRYYK